MRGSRSHAANAVGDQLLTWRLRWIGAVGAFLALVTVLDWTTVLKLAAGFYFVVGWYHHFQEYEFWVLGLNRGAEVRPNRWAPRDLAPLLVPYLAFLGITYSPIQFEFFLLAALYNGIVHDGIIPQYVLSEESQNGGRPRRTALLLLHLPALVLFALGIAGGFLDYAYKGELHHAVTGFSRYAQLLGEPNPWFLAISSFIAYAHAITWITTIRGRIQARAELAQKYNSPVARAVRYVAGIFFVGIWSYGLWQAWPDNPEGFHIVTTVFLYSSLLHQWSELLLVFKYYGTAARQLEVAA
ncbi:MAG: hypothetical protein HY726_01075 [Candidatus Rokubacteria bacterium]|nr:hypothetical protein [Candidatus Rokubacteria bacterium]